MRWVASLLVLVGCGVVGCGPAGCGGKRAAPVPAPGRADATLPAAAAQPDGALATASDACAGTSSEDVRFAAADGLVVHGRMVRPCGASAVVVLAHQMCRDHDEWSASGHDWVAALSARGIATLAIDLRGHGASTVWPDGAHHDLCKQIGEAAVRDLYLGMAADVAAAVAFARAHLGVRKVALVGASIGANSALVTYTGDPAIAMVVALSPGLDYRGIKTEAALASTAGRPILLEAARDDPRSADAVAHLGKANPGLTTQIWPSGGHGNAMIDAHPDELTRVVGELAAHL